MNPFEKQLQVGREMMELNAGLFRKFAEYDAGNVQKYVELNQTYMQKLPQVQDVQSFVELQREYGETLWNGTQEVMKTRGEMMRDAAQANGELIRSAFTTEEKTEEAPKAAAKSAKKEAAAA